MENSLLYLMTMIKFVGNQKFAPLASNIQNVHEADQMLEEGDKELDFTPHGANLEQEKEKHQPMVEIVTTRITYPIPAVYDEHRMEEYNATFQIFEFSKTAQKTCDSSSVDSEASAGDSEDEKLKKTRSVASVNPAKQKTSLFPGQTSFERGAHTPIILGKRQEMNGLSGEPKSSSIKGSNIGAASTLPRQQNFQAGGIVESYKKYSEQLSKHYQHKQR